MKVTQNEIVDRQTILSIEVDADSLEQHLSSAYKRLVVRVNVPGFRRGKAPRPVFENAYGRERLVEESLETMVPEVVEKAVKQAGLEAVGTPRVSILERDPAPKIEATIPLKPIVTLGDYQSISVDEQLEPVTEDQVDLILERMRAAQATWEPLESGASIGDMVVFGTIEGIADKEKFFSASDLEYVVASDSTYPAPGFGTEVVGLGSGDSKEFSLILPDDFPEKNVAGKTAVFSVIVTEVKRSNVPPLDDELARGAGEGFKDLKEMRERITKDLEAQASEYHTRQVQDKALDAVLDQATVDVAPITVEREVEHVINERRQALARYNLSLDEYMKNAGKSPDDVLNDARTAALSRIQRSLVLEELAQSEDLKIKDEEVTNEIKKLRESAKTSEERTSYLSDRARDTVHSIMLQRATLARLVEIAKPTTIDSDSKKITKKSKPSRNRPKSNKKRSSPNLKNKVEK